MARSGEEGETSVGALPRLISRWQLTIDDKGRLVVPASHRPRYERGAILSPRGDHIAMYEPAEWDAFVDQLRAYRMEGRVSRETFNWITMNAADPTPDRAGRILVPGWMRDQVHLGREVLVTGNHEYLGIYPHDYIVKIDPNVARLAAAQVNELGL